MDEGSDAEPLFTNAHVCMTLRRGNCIWIGVHATPTVDTIDSIFGELRTFLARKRRFAVHIEHYGDAVIVAPCWQEITCIVGHLLKIKDVLTPYLLGTCIQATKLDEPVHLARNMLFMLYKPARIFDIVVGAEAAQRLLHEIHAAPGPPTEQRKA